MHAKLDLVNDLEKCIDKHNVRQLNKGAVHKAKQQNACVLLVDRRSKMIWNSSKDIKRTDTYHVFDELSILSTSLLQILAHSDHGTKPTTSIDSVLENTHPGIKSGALLPVLHHLVQSFQNQFVTHGHLAVRQERQHLNDQLSCLEMWGCY